MMLYFYGLIMCIRRLQFCLYDEIFGILLLPTDGTYLVHEFHVLYMHFHRYEHDWGTVKEGVLG